MLPTNSSCFTKAVNYPHLSTFILMINSLSIPGSVCETPDYESKNKRRRLLIKVRSVIQLKYIYSIGYYFKFNNINNTNRLLAVRDIIFPDLAISSAPSTRIVVE